MKWSHYSVRCEAVSVKTKWQTKICAVKVVKWVLYISNICPTLKKVVCQAPKGSWGFYFFVFFRLCSELQMFLHEQHSPKASFLDDPVQLVKLAEPAAWFWNKYATAGTLFNKFWRVWQKITAQKKVSKISESDVSAFPSLENHLGHTMLLFVREEILDRNRKLVLKILVFSTYWI